MTIDIKDRLYTSSEVAEILGVSLRSVYRYLEEGKLNADIKTATGRHRFSKQNIVEFLKPQEEATPVNKFTNSDNYTFQTRNKPDYFQDSKDDFSLDDVVDKFDFKFDDDLDLDDPLSRGYKDVVEKNSLGSLGVNPKSDSGELDLTDEELDKLFDEIMTGDTSNTFVHNSTQSNSQGFKRDLNTNSNITRGMYPNSSNDLNDIFNLDDFEDDEEDNNKASGRYYKDTKDVKKEPISLDDDEFDEIFNLRKEQKSTFSWREEPNKKDTFNSKNSSFSSQSMKEEDDDGGNEEQDFSWLDDLLGEDPQPKPPVKKDTPVYDTRGSDTTYNPIRSPKLNNISDDFFDDLDFNLNPNHQSSKKSSLEEELEKEEEEYLKKLEEIRKKKTLSSQGYNTPTSSAISPQENKASRNFYDDFPSPVKNAPTEDRKSIKEDAQDSDDWISRFRKATENLQSNSNNSVDRSLNSNTTNSNSLTDKIDQFFTNNKTTSEVSSSKNSNWLGRLGSSQKEQHFYKSGVGNLKEIAQQLDKIAKKFDLDYSFTLHAGLSLHKPIAPFSTIHAYISLADLEIFEDYLKLSSCDSEDAHLCLIVPKSINIFEESYELHGLSVVSNIQLRSDFIDRGLDNLAREV